MSKYEPLSHYLNRADGESVEASFAEIEQILGFPLPESATRHQAWWANEKHGSHSHARSWQDAGWLTRDVNLARRTVRFARAGQRPGPAPTMEPPNAPHAAAELEVLFDRAAKLTRQTDRGELMRIALEALIHHESVKYLASLGGSMPDAKAPPRRRFA